MVSLAEGFGLNTDILDTNILNLVVVIGVLVTNGRAALDALLTARRERVLTALQGADARYKEAQIELETAMAEYEAAAAKVITMELEGGDKMAAIYAKEAEELEALDALYEDLKQAAFTASDARVRAWFRDTLIERTFEKVPERVKARMTPQLHKKYIDAKIELMTRTL